MAFIRKLLALGLAVGCGWLLHVYGSGHLLSATLLETDELAQPVVVPAYLSADALVRVAEKQLSTSKPEALGLRALAQDPANGGAAALLLTQFMAEGREAEAATVADLAGRLWPVHTYTHSRLADYWISLNRVDKLIPELSVLLIREPGLRRDFYPVIETLTVGSGNLALLEPYINAPPNWWNGFFGHLSTRVAVDTLTNIYQLRLASGVAVDISERSSFVKRLIREGSWTEAFRQWQAGLDGEQRARLVNGFYDGGFEGEAFNLEFGWVFGRDKRFEIKPRNTYGMSGKQALQISFRQGLNRINFKHLSQTLLLAPGSYELSFKSRLDALKNPKGLVWRVRCVSQADGLLAEGEPLVDRKPWQVSSFAFKVPKSCAVQSLRLEAVSQYPHEHVFSGQLWLDDVALKPVSGVSQ